MHWPPAGPLSHYIHSVSPCPQVHSMIQNLAQFTDVRAALVVGGLSSQLQASTLRSNPEVVVATPVSTLQAPSWNPEKG